MEIDSTEGVELYLRFLNERLADLRQAVDTLLEAFADKDQNRKAQAARTAEGALTNLLGGLSATDRPEWTATLQTALQIYIQRNFHREAAHQLLKRLVTVYGPLNAHNWTLADAVEAVDFEGVYRRYSDEARLAELLDEIADKLSAIVESGQVDSLRVIRVLERVIATLRKNAWASYFSKRGAWEFASAAFQNFVWEALSDLPAVGAAVRALRKTVDDVNAEIDKMDNGIKTGIAALAELELLLPKPAAKQLTSGQAGDGLSSMDVSIDRPRQEVPSTALLNEEELA